MYLMLMLNLVCLKYFHIYKKTTQFDQTNTVFDFFNTTSGIFIK